MTPAALRRIGKTRLAGWLANHSVRNAAVIAAAAVEAAHAQHSQVPARRTAAAMTRIPPARWAAEAARQCPYLLTCSLA
ncbi:hypothetical protein [Streptomyces sp. NPDC056821]|uniref:hypothetical protein n=1 Tax=unclassified Streptomyces TaxID=2593676 RepID=UPI0036944CE5